MLLASAEACNQSDMVGKLKVGKLRSKYSDVMKMTGKFLAEGKDSSSETGSQQIRHLSDSQVPFVVSASKKKNTLSNLRVKILKIWMKLDT